MSGGSVGSPTKARSDPASHPIQTMTDSADPAIHPQQTSGSLTASKMRKQGSDRSAERLACTGQPDSLRYLAYAFSIPTTCIETTFISLEKGQMQIRFKQSYRKSISLSKLRTHRRRRDGHWYI